MSALCLLLLAGQTSGLTLLMRYTLHHRRQQPDSQGYSAASVVVSVEALKLLASLAMELVTGVGTRTPTRVLCTLFRDVRCHPGPTLKLAIPAALYALQNNMSYYALARVSAVSFQVIQQLKILTTALFAVLLLGKRLSWRHWAALGVLTVGVVLVQLSNVLWRRGEEHGAGTGSTVAEAWLGFLAMVVNSLSSGFAGIYFEKLVKGSAGTAVVPAVGILPRPEPPVQRIPSMLVTRAHDDNDDELDHAGVIGPIDGASHQATVVHQRSLWIQSIELGVFGLFFSLLVLAGEWEGVREAGGFWAGYDGFTWAVVVMQALGGLLVALVVRYADSILKAFATSASIVLSAILGHCFRLEQLSPSQPPTTSSPWISGPLLTGAILVGVALYWYAVADKLQTQMLARLTAVSAATDKTHKL